MARGHDGEAVGAAPVEAVAGVCGLIVKVLLLLRPPGFPPPVASAPTGADATGTVTRRKRGPSGQGLTSTVLHDVDGPVGHAQQILTVRPLPGA
ncbi:hypothetical protein ADL04_02430 [Streptomyces sp. NRRL B-3648]|nr:hypothetical protein ADL04_02430 [Streptomyces sp. NRRL B-3648]